jgi:hypothetical protein
MTFRVPQRFAGIAKRARGNAAFHLCRNFQIIQPIAAFQRLFPFSGCGHARFADSLQHRQSVRHPRLFLLVVREMWCGIIRPGTVVAKGGLLNVDTWRSIEE